MTSPDEGRGPVLDLLAKMSVSLGNVDKHLEKADADRRRQRELNQNIFPLELELIPVTASAITDQPNTMGPRTGWYWDIETAIATGVSAGKITLYAKTPVAQGTTITGVVWATWTVDGQFNWGKKQFYLQANQRIVLVGNAALSAGAQVSIYGTQVAAPYWGDYII